MKYLSRKQVLEINRATIAEHGGKFVPPENILNADRLDYVLDAVSSEVFGEKLFKTEVEVAAAYLFYLVTGHVFSGRLDLDIVKAWFARNSIRKTAG